MSVHSQVGLVISASLLHFVWKIFPSGSYANSFPTILPEAVPGGTLSHTVSILDNILHLFYLIFLRLYHAWNDDILATIPPTNLLVFDVRSGWEPLCQFLGCPQPETPFPRYMNNLGNSIMIFKLI